MNPLLDCDGQRISLIFEIGCWLELGQSLEPQASTFLLLVAEHPRLDDLVGATANDILGVLVHDRILDGDVGDVGLKQLLEELGTSPHLVEPILLFV